MKFSLVIPDSSPLITLAAAKALDVLLKPGLPVLVPDGVHWEVTRHTAMLGATEIVEWMSRHSQQVRLSPTQEFVNAQQLIRSGARRVKNLGERCAVELVDREAERDGSARSILLYEDSDVTLIRIANPERVATLTTADFLAGLEAGRMIQSADKILDDAVTAGRDSGIRNRSTLDVQQAFLDRHYQTR